MSKQLNRLQKDGLLKSKAYGLGKQKLWFLVPHSINKEEGYVPPKRTVHPYKYEHEKACAQVFVVFAQGEIYGWEQHKKISKEIIPDRTVYLTEDTPMYIEVELGDRDRVSQKISNYQRYFRETREKFKVLFIVNKMRQWEPNPYYKIDLLDNYFPKNVPNDVPDDSTPKNTTDQ